MKNKLYFISGYHALVYCHEETETNVVLGGLCTFVADAKWNILRQTISKVNFIKLRPIIINEADLDGYKFIKTHEFTPTYKAYRTTPVKHRCPYFLHKAQKFGIGNDQWIRNNLFIER